MSICLYQGSFNPIHNAHLAVAKYVYNNFNFDKITFIPAFIPPHKDLNNFGTINAFHRLNMVELAIKDIPYFEVSAIEYTRNKPSYTYDTIIQIYEIVKPKEKINFIIGTDAFENIETWHRSEDLKKLIDFILFIREENFNETKILNLKAKGYNYKLMKMPFIDISSSLIREKIKHNENICDIVPLSVANYIKENAVYKI
mgnify:CR=1 FL=1